MGQPEMGQPEMGQPEMGQRKSIPDGLLHDVSRASTRAGER
jgi:hypothetical protein